MARHSTGNLRIIGGSARSRRLKFTAIGDLRPTPDRVRETLFNWLQNEIAGSHCADLFAGSGALGFEALSRGAARVTLVESHPRICKDLESNLSLLGFSHGEVVKQPVENYLDTCESKFDVVFLDPPYRLNILPNLLQRLVDRELLRKDAMIYVEHHQSNPIPELPTVIKPWRQKICGAVEARLIHYTG